MKSRIIEFDPEKREVMKAWQDFKDSINSAGPEEFKGALFYLDPAKSSMTAHLSVFGPDWQLTGRMKMFMQELETDNYIRDFEIPEDSLPDE